MRQNNTIVPESLLNDKTHVGEKQSQLLDFGASFSVSVKARESSRKVASADHFLLSMVDS